jgi:hypothetical protein
MILERKNPAANPDNMLKLGSNVPGCADPAEGVFVCKYLAEIDVTSVTTASKIQIGGVDYPFGQTFNLNASDTTPLVDAIKAALVSAGFISSGVIATLSGDTLTVETAYSEAVFNHLESTPGGDFTATHCAPREMIAANDGQKPDTAPMPVDITFDDGVADTNYSGNVSTNDVVGSFSGITYELVAGSPSGGTVPSFDTDTGDFTADPTASTATAVTFSYNMLLNGNFVGKADVTVNFS